MNVKPIRPGVFEVTYPVRGLTIGPDLDNLPTLVCDHLVTLQEFAARIVATGLDESREVNPYFYMSGPAPRGPVDREGVMADLADGSVISYEVGRFATKAEQAIVGDRTERIVAQLSGLRLLAIARGEVDLEP